MMPVAEASTVVTRLQNVPTSAWLYLGGGLVGLILLVVILRKLANVNKVVLGVIVGLVVTFIGFNWIYERNEPKWASPVVEKLAAFFPTKGSVK